MTQRVTVAVAIIVTATGLASGTAGIVLAIATHSNNNVVSGTATGGLVLAYSAAMYFLVSALVGCMFGLLAGLALAPFASVRRLDVQAKLLFPVSIVVGVSAARFGGLAALYVVLTQALIVFGVWAMGHDPREGQFSPSRRVTKCPGCRYSLAGLDRRKIAVCPECGEPIPSSA